MSFITKMSRLFVVLGLAAMVAAPSLAAANDGTPTTVKPRPTVAAKQQTGIMGQAKLCVPWPTAADTVKPTPTASRCSRVEGYQTSLVFTKVRLTASEAADKSIAGPVWTQTDEKGNFRMTLRPGYYHVQQGPVATAASPSMHPMIVRVSERGYTQITAWFFYGR